MSQAVVAAPQAPARKTRIQPRPITRVWRYNGRNLEDPLPGRTVEAVRRIHALAHPALNNAKVDGPTLEGDLQVYTYTVNAATFG